MDKKQGEKFEDFYKHTGYSLGSKSYERIVWQACLEANGIGGDGRSMDTEQSSRIVDKDKESNLADSNGAPEWVIDIMRTGKPVRCYVQRYSKDEGSLAFTRGRFKVTGYSIHKGFRAAGEWWDEAIPEDKADTEKFKDKRPIPAWKPQDGEAVFVRQRDHVGAPWEIAYGTFSDGKVYFGRHCMSAGLLCLKPFDGDYSKIGKPWSEIV